MDQLTFKDITAMVEIASNANAAENRQNQKTTAFIEARVEIISKLLLKAYSELNMKIPPTENLLQQALTIANKADISNYHLKWAFDEAVERKKYDDFKTPITANDLEIAIQKASSMSNTYSGKNNKRLPKLADKELWGVKVLEYAQKFEQNELAVMKQQLGYTPKPTASICQDEAINAVKQIASSLKRV